MRKHMKRELFGHHQLGHLQLNYVKEIDITCLM